MNKISYICLLLTVFWLSSCQKEEIRRYEQRAGVYFSTYQSSFSFIDQPDSDIAIVRLPRWTSRGCPPTTTASLPSPSPGWTR